MSIYNNRVVEHNDQQVEEVAQVQRTLQDQATQESDIAQQTQRDEAPPKTGSKQWKALYESISNYAKEVRSNKA